MRLSRRDVVKSTCVARSFSGGINVGADALAQASAIYAGRKKDWHR